MLRKNYVWVAICLLLLGTRNLSAQEITPATPAPSIQLAFSPNSFAVNPITRSIHEWATCDGKTDDSLNVAKAFAAAANNAFTLVVDCPVYIHVGMNISRPIFVDSGTTVQFEGSGLFILDNSLIPAFVIANSRNVDFLNWNVEYVGAESLSPMPGFFCEDPKSTPFTTGSGCMPNEQFSVATGYAPAHYFLLEELGPWLAAHRNITYQSNIPDWHGPANTSSLFYIIGDTAHMIVQGMTLFVPADAGGNRFMPMIFTMLPSPDNNQIVSTAEESSATPSPSVYAVPDGLNFTNIDIDGAYMSWQGIARDVTITHVRSHRYGDLQDANGGTIGGVGEWFPPPHLFYFNYFPSWDASLHSNNIHISDVIDYGNRVGAARDTVANCCSGNALSLKIGADNSTVNDYVSDRPDGFLDVLSCQGLTISNVIASYNSAFLNNLYPGIRFPSNGYYNNIALVNIWLTDLAPATQTGAVHPTGSDINVSNITFINVNVLLNNWSGNPLSTPVGTYVTGTGYLNDFLAYYFPGGGHNIVINYLINAMKINALVKQQDFSDSFYTQPLVTGHYSGIIGQINNFKQSLPP